MTNTPSHKDGVDERTEILLRLYGCELIQEAGILLKMHQTAIVTGQIIFHRFFFRESMVKCDVRSVAKAALFLGSKIEEQPRKTQDILNVFHASAMNHLGKRIEPLATGTTRFVSLREELFNAESAILRELGFIIHAEHAHKFVLYYIRVLFGQIPPQYPELPQRSWNYANDAYRSIICLKYPAYVLACGAIFLASRDLGINLPEDPPWWNLFDAEKEQVESI
uniref:Cyclin N-terminal domain-containing protein n=1 Tax=Guillardia theta (strain CCMP2712) TaxID=905079 RepID=A0A0C3TIV6_GUITC